MHEPASVSGMSATARKAEPEQAQRQREKAGSSLI